MGEMAGLQSGLDVGRSRVAGLDPAGEVRCSQAPERPLPGLWERSEAQPACVSTASCPPQASALPAPCL